jgi:hypothetical protein
MKKTLFVLTTIILVFNSCKKDKLTGDAMDLIGEWNWISSKGEEYDTPDSCNCSKTLSIREQGKYILVGRVKRKEGGRITFQNEVDTLGKNYFKVKFLRNALYAKSEFIGECALSLSHIDTLIITENIPMTDQPTHIYIREK